MGTVIRTNRQGLAREIDYICWPSTKPVDVSRTSGGDNDCGIYTRVTYDRPRGLSAAN